MMDSLYELTHTEFLEEHCAMVVIYESEFAKFSEKILVCAVEECSPSESEYTYGDYTLLYGLIEDINSGLHNYSQFLEIREGKKNEIEDAALLEEYELFLTLLNPKSFLQHFGSKLLRIVEDMEMAIDYDPCFNTFNFNGYTLSIWPNEV